MKINLLKSSLDGNSARCGLALLALLLSIWLTLTPSAAQSKSQKRITSVYIGEAREGSRVTLVSDASLNDYEAFRRGDRFYVRLPLADFAAGRPGFRGDGFEDVQVQKVRDSLVISFKLQPGATARVDQSANRLEVIFTSPNKVTPSNRRVEPNRAYVPADGIVRVNNAQSARRPNRDANGPMPPGSPVGTQATRDRVVTERVGDSQTSRRLSVSNNRGEAARGISNSRQTANTTAPRGQTSPRTTRSEPPSNTNKADGLPNTSKSGSPSTVSRYEPSTSATPSNSPSYPALATHTSPTPVASQPAVKSPGVNGVKNGKNWSDVALQWVKANRQQALLGGLSLIVFLVILALLLRRRKKLKTQRPTTTLAKPKPLTNIGLDSASQDAQASSPASGLAPREVVNEGAPRPVAEPSPVASANGSQANRAQEKVGRGERIPGPVVAESVPAATPANSPAIPAVLISSQSEEDQEREVFEL